MSNTKNFIVTNNKNGGIIVQTKTYDWKMEFSAESNHGQILKFYIEKVSEEKINDLLTDLYVTSCTMLTDMKFKEHVMDFFSEKIKDAEVLQEVTEEEEKENLKTVQDDTDKDT